MKKLLLIAGLLATPSIGWADQLLWSQENVVVEHRDYLIFDDAVRSGKRAVSLVADQKSFLVLQCTKGEELMVSLLLGKNDAPRAVGKTIVKVSTGKHTHSYVTTRSAAGSNGEWLMTIFEPDALRSVVPSPMRFIEQVFKSERFDVTATNPKWDAPHRYEFVNNPAALLYVIDYCGKKLRGVKF